MVTLTEKEKKPTRTMATMFLLRNFFYQNPQCPTQFGQDHYPTGTSKSGGIRHSKCRLIEQMSQITMVAARLALPHNLHLKPAEI